ncbi:MAG: Asp-tRNA(Asn)/Glu-tRNA(Gln) amidotransferase subunit GatA [Coriobacteriales bacterium]|jgi:aspartyl-tRNA(Asn)/glutamyl-tRNA(Gln) amidotransferase subunit A|nr:Asp-tRNA(Asn)/Glu-tRNA(Gln) amidotransferase subunit GatA [Coriobacteriales bacterium]
MDFTSTSIEQIRAGLIDGDFSAAELADATFAQIDANDGEVHAFLEHTESLAHTACEHIDKLVHDYASSSSTKNANAGTGIAADGLPPLLGIPMAYKDNMNLTDTYTTCASHMLENYISPYTATCVQKTLDAGAIPTGKLNMDEFAFGSSTETSAFGPTKNPHDRERVPGGSSGGSAAAVAAGMVPATLGSDTGGSIRQPAAFCGVVGFKPTYGVVSRYGVVAFGSSLDQVGPFANSVADAAAVMDAICGRDLADCTSQHVAPIFKVAARDGFENGIKGMNVGVVPAYLDAEGVTPEVKAALKGAISNLEGMGANIVEVELPNAKAALSAYYVIGPAEAFSNLSRFDSVRYGYRASGATSLDEQYEESRKGGFGKEVVRRIMLGSYLLSSGIYNEYYYPAQQVRTLITQDYVKAFAQCDALITPVSPRTAFKFNEVSDPTSMYLSDIFTIPANIAGNGGMSLPVGMGADTGLPVAVQILGPQFKDENIFKVAAALETCYDDTIAASVVDGDVKAGDAQ